MNECCGYRGPSPCFIVDMMGHSVVIGRCLRCGELQMSNELPPTKEWIVVNKEAAQRAKESEQ